MLEENQSLKQDSVVKPRGRPKGSKNRPKLNPLPTKEKKKRGRPRGSTAKKLIVTNAESLQVLNESPRKQNVGHAPVFKDAKAARALLEKLKKKLLKQAKSDNSSDATGYFRKDIITACRVVYEFIEGNNWVLLIAPMQSGKTAVEAIVALLLQSINPEIRHMTHICGNPQRDLTEQTEESLDETPLAHVKRHKLNRLSIANNSPSFFCFDEVHFGTAKAHTIGKFLRANDLYRNPTALVFAVSATPFAALASGNFKEVWVREEDVRPLGYNSVSLMLEKKRVVDAQALFRTERSSVKGKRGQVTKVEVLQGSNIFRFIVRLFNRKKLFGYVIIRCTKQEQQAMEALLKDMFGERAGLKSYNQNSPRFKPEQYFKKKREGQITFVFVQQMARMGIRIPSEYIWAAYEYSKNASVETIAQSLLGRLCGFGKQNHTGIIFTHLAHAQAFSLFSKGDIRGFLGHVGSNSLTPSIRAKLMPLRDSMLVEVGRLAFPKGTPSSSYEQTARTFAKSQFGVSNLSFRTLSHHTFDYSRSFRKWDLTTPPNYFSVAGSLGAMTAIVLDRYQNHVTWQADWDGIAIRFIQRVMANGEPHLVPRDCAFSEKE